MFNFNSYFRYILLLTHSQSTNPGVANCFQHTYGVATRYCFNIKYFFWTCGFKIFYIFWTCKLCCLLLDICHFSKITKLFGYLICTYKLYKTNSVSYNSGGLTTLVLACIWGLRTCFKIGTTVTSRTLRPFLRLRRTYLILHT